MSDGARLCKKCRQPISAQRLEEVPVATLCEKCLRPRPCESCGKMIPVERLDANPQTRRCMDCTRRLGEDTELAIATVNTGKPGSLKKGATVVGSTRFRRKKQPE